MALSGAVDQERLRRRHKRDVERGNYDAIRRRLHWHLSQDPYDLWAREQLGLAYRHDGMDGEAGRWLALSPLVKPREAAAFKMAIPRAKRRWELIGWPAAPHPDVDIAVQQRLYQLQQQAESTSWGKAATLGHPMTSWEDSVKETLGCVIAIGVFLLLATATIVGVITIGGWVWDAVS